MDGSTVEHSDSDSGESWTLLDNVPKHGDGAPDFPENLPFSESENIEVHNEKDDDTDGISIISDSDHESSPICDVNHVKLAIEDNNLAEENTPLLASPPAHNINHNNESVSDQTDFLGDNVKYKTYVHRRNHKVGTILDIIMLGTFIITAGMALGHLWSCKNECTTPTSVNKILSNLYKLQEENAYLRNKLNEVTQATGYQVVQHRKTSNSRLPAKQHRCKKIFEEPVIKNNKVELAVRCVNDNQPDVILQDPLAMPEYEKEFLKDVDKMKDIYNTNKNWLDAEVKKQFEEIAKSTNAKDKTNVGLKSLELNENKQFGPIFTPVDKHLDGLQDTNSKPTNVKKSPRQTNLDQQLGPIYYELPLNTETDIRDDDKTKSNLIKPHRQIHLELQLGSDQNTNPHNLESIQSDESFEIVPEKKITYADSLKVDQPLQGSRRSDDNDKPRKWIQDNISKKKQKDNEVSLNLSSLSEDDSKNIKKDDRYTGPKVKHEKKKHDRQKPHKKQKRNNKYEQWEMKGGYLRDFDEFSVTSSQDNDILTNHPEKKFLNPHFENYINKLIDTERNISKKDLPKATKNNNEKPNKAEKISLKGKKGKNKDSEWYDERSALRAEARMKLEQELFNENTSNNAAWYFRRMQKREQCRAQKDNLFKKLYKRKLNFKMKR